MALQDSLEQLRNLDVGSLDLNNVGAWPAAVKWLLQIALLAVVLGSGYSLQISDKLKDLDTSKAKEVRLKKQYQDKAAQAASLDAYRQQKKEMEDSSGFSNVFG